jgi:hypothetical protein
MPAEHAGAATAYLALRLVEEFHGQPVNGYEVLERAGLIQKTVLEPIQAQAASPLNPGANTAEEAAGLLDAVEEIIIETRREFEKLPAFVRPIARNGFKNKAGKSLDDWLRSLNMLKNQVEIRPEGRQPAIPGKTLLELPAQLDRLITYYEGVPSETARFTRDKTMLEEVARICDHRIQTIRKLKDSFEGLS